MEIELQEKESVFKPVGNHLKQHCDRNYRQLLCVLSHYKRDLTDLAKYHSKALLLINMRAYAREAIIADLKAGYDNTQQIYIVPRENETRLKDNSSLLRVKNSHGSLKDLNIDGLVAAAIDNLLELQWQKALQYFLHYACITKFQDYPCIYLALLLIAITDDLNSTATVTSLWRDADLAVAAYQRIQQSESLQKQQKDWMKGFNTELRDLQKLYQQALQSKNKDIFTFDSQQRRLFYLLPLLKATLTHNPNLEEKKDIATDLDIFDRYYRNVSIEEQNLECLIAAFQLFSQLNKEQQANFYAARIKEKLQEELPIETTLQPALKSQLQRRALELYKLKEIWKSEDKDKCNIKLGEQIKLEVNVSSLSQAEMEHEEYSQMVLMPDSAEEQTSMEQFLSEKHESFEEDPIAISTRGNSGDDHSGKQQQLQLSELLKSPDRLQQCFIRMDELRQVVGLMNFYWYDEHSNIATSVQGTGFLISPNIVITAKHNLYNKKKHQDRCHNCTIQLISASAPNQVIIYRSTASQQWFESSGCDMAAVVLDKPVLHFRNNIQFATRNDALRLRPSDELLLLGYSYQYRKQGQPDQLKCILPSFTRFGQPFCEYEAETVSGLSGSPVFLRANASSFYVLSMHISRNAESNSCRSIYFNERLVNQLNIWIEARHCLQVSTELSFQQLKNAFNCLEETVHCANKQLDFNFILKYYRDRLLLDRENFLLAQEISCKLQKLAHPEDIQRFYADLCFKQGLAIAKKELERLHLPFLEPILTPEVDSSFEDNSDMSCMLQAIDGELSSISSCPNQVDYLSSSFFDFQLVNMEGVSFLQRKIFFTFTPNKPFNNFLRHRYNSFRAIIKYLSEVPLHFIPRHSLHHSNKKSIQFLVEEGINFQKWMELMDRGLLLVLLRDMCSMVIELLEHRIYLADLERRNIILFLGQQTPASLCNSQHILRNIHKASFKLVDFQYAICLANKETKEHAVQMLKLGVQLSRKDNQELRQEPIAPFLHLAAKNNRKNISITPELEQCFKDEYKNSLLSKISCFSASEDQVFLKTEELTFLEALCAKSDYRQMVQYLSGIIQQELS